MAQTNPEQRPNQALNAGGCHSRSLSQPTVFAGNCLPPLSPLPPSESPSNSNLKNASVEEIDARHRRSGTGLSSPQENPFHGANGLAPPRGHRCSNSDVPLGFSAMIQSSPLVPISSQGSLVRTENMRENSGNGKSIKSTVEGIVQIKTEGEVVDDMLDSFMNLDHVGALNSVADNRDKDTILSGTNMNGADRGNSESETITRHGTYSKERVKRSAAEDIAPQLRHYRSLSMDSSIAKFHFADSSTQLMTSLSNQAGQLSPSNSLSENLAKINLDFGHVEFNEVELKKIMADERLAEIAVSDPKRVRRILANRLSAARSKERKLRYISELEHKVKTLQTEATTLSAQITTLQKDNADLVNQNNELKFRVQAMQQQAKLRDALHETLTAEVKRLKVANMELREEGRKSNGVEQQQVPEKHHMFPMQGKQPSQIQ